jgi:methylmalonyl-CoA/ethylmalonyl-CoA epimerase
LAHEGEEAQMTVALGRLGQVALPTRDVDRSEAFYGTALGLHKLFRHGDLTFFDCQSRP